MPDLIFKLAIATTVFNALFYLLAVRKQNRVINTFALFIIISALAEIITYFTANSNNLYLMPIYTVGEFAILAFFFIFIFKKSMIWSLPVAIGCIFIIINSLFLQSLDQFNSNSKAAIYFIFISLSIFTFFKLLSEENRKEIDSVIKYFLFGLLLNFTGSFVLYLFANVITTFSIETQKNLWYFNIALNIISQLLYFKGLYDFRKIAKTT